jgi:acetyltransferase-like isoleucine patch superfamily enzyme
MNDKINVGNFTYGHQNINLYSFSREGASVLNIGKFCSIAFGLNVLFYENHRTDWITTYPFGHVYPGVFCEPIKEHPISNEVEGDHFTRNTYGMLRENADGSYSMNLNSVLAPIVHAHEYYD